MKNILALTLLSLFLSISTTQAQSCNYHTRITSEYTVTDGNQVAQQSEWKLCDNQVIWIQQGSTQSYDLTMDITGTSGSWDVATSTGDITYSLRLDSYEIELRLFSEAGTTRLLMDVDGGGSGENTEIIVSNLTYH